MRFPSKITSYKDSIISRFPVVLSLLEQREFTIYELFGCCKDIPLVEFVEVLDYLFILGGLKFNKQTGVISYAAANFK